MLSLNEKVNQEKEIAKTVKIYGQNIHLAWEKLMKRKHETTEM